MKREHDPTTPWCHGCFNEFEDCGTPCVTCTKRPRAPIDEVLTRDKMIWDMRKKTSEF